MVSVNILAQLQIFTKRQLTREKLNRSHFNTVSIMFTCFSHNTYICYIKYESLVIVETSHDFVSIAFFSSIKLMLQLAANNCSPTPLSTC